MPRRRSLPLLAVLLVLSACPSSKPPDPSTPGTTAGPPPKRGGTLRVLLTQDVDALDPQRASQPPAFDLLRAMHRGLMAFPAEPGGAGARPVPDLADGPPTVSPDGIRYEFKLRDGAAFGPPASHPVGAADVKAGLERAISAKSPIASALRVIAGASAFADRRVPAVAGIAAPDERTVVITLARPANDLLWLLALPAASAVPPGLPTVTSPDKIAGAGPYRLDEGGYKPERSITLVRNIGWTKDSDPVRAAWVDRIEVEIGVPAAQIRERLLDGDADLSGDTPVTAAVPAAVPAARMLRSPNGCLRYLFMNVRVAPFNSGRVRRAVAAALPRTSIARSFGSAGAVPAGTILPPTVDGNDPGIGIAEPDPAAVKRALAAAGFPGGFATTLVLASQPLDLAQAGLVKAALARAGVRVAIRTVPISNLYEDHYEVAAARTPMGIATWCADWPGLGGRGMLSPLVDGRTLAPRGTNNYSGVKDPKLDALLDAALFEQDPAAAASRWRVAAASARGLAAVVPLAFLIEPNLLGPDVRGFVPHPFLLRGDLTAVWLDRP